MGQETGKALVAVRVTRKSRLGLKDDNWTDLDLVSRSSHDDVGGILRLVLDVVWRGLCLRRTKSTHCRHGVRLGWSTDMIFCSSELFFR